MERAWLSHYPTGVGAEIDPDAYPHLTALLQATLSKHAEQPAFSSFGRSLSFQALDDKSTRFAAWLQGQGLKPGDRVALMMPNLLQYPVALIGVLKAGMTVVNVNPLYTDTELAHQLRDSGAKLIVILENFAATLQACLAQTPIERVLITRVGDELGVKGWAINTWLKLGQRKIPAYQLPDAQFYPQALANPPERFVPPRLRGEDLAFLQYTGGTTGVSKGAALTHRNMVANVLQCAAWMVGGSEAQGPEAQGPEAPVFVCALPLYHIFGLTACCLLGLHVGGMSLLMVNPRDLRAVVKVLKAHRFTHFPGVNTLFKALLGHPAFASLDFSSLRVTVGGGMAVHQDVARRWKRLTGCVLSEGYGLSEMAPVVMCTPINDDRYLGTIGFPLPSTDAKVLDPAGRPLGPGQEGELAVRGPQRMSGYWQAEEETGRVLTPDGYLLTGDIAIAQEDGSFRLVDRKKDMVIVSGFNVYPSEVEAVVEGCPGVKECAAIGVPDEHAGEVIKLFVIAESASLDTETVQRYCRQHLTGYKRPRQIEFVSNLPRSSVGKILRRALR
ncbi:MAG: AMP-binding protein [Pigmentiphaga sp.]|nr:AMP-binding protein [Pigmentiphaga sp.]